MKHYFTIIFTFITIFSFSQEGQIELVTDRPDQTESSSVVPHKFLQIETGFVLETNKNQMFETKSYALNTSLLRYGLFKNFELRFGIEYLQDNITTSLTGMENKVSGTSPLYAGFKVKLLDEKSWIPEIAFLGALNLPFTAYTYYKPKYVSPNLRFSFSHTLSDRFSLGYNLGAEWDGDSVNPNYFYSFVLGMSVTKKIGFFAENYGLLVDGLTNEHIFDAGFTFLILSNLQADISGGIGLNEQATDGFISTGLTWRLPN